MKPASLYKYRALDASGFAIRMLTHNEIYFASPVEFNDPFDCRVSIDYQTGTLSEKNKLWRRIINREMPSLTARQKDLLLKDLVSSRLGDPALIRRSQQFTEEYPSKHLGVFSLASNHSSLLMWSHYASSHTGIAIGFHHKRFIEFCHQVYLKENRLLVLQAVRYDTTYPIINPYRHTDVQRMELQLLSKSKEWSYEREYRGLLYDGPSQTIILPEDIITRVVLGCRINEANRDLVLDVIGKKKRHIPVFQAERTSGSYLLSFNRIH